MECSFECVGWVNLDRLTRARLLRERQIIASLHPKPGVQLPRHQSDSGCVSLINEIRCPISFKYKRGALRKALKVHSYTGSE